MGDVGQDGWQISIGYNAGFIVLSYFVSWVGAATCLELLYRRTSRKGLYNWYLLITAAITMGGIGIWCMHFIGNLAIQLATSKNGPIAYNSACTAASFFLPIFVLLTAFYLLGAIDKATSANIIVSGTLGGGAICGMHYLGQQGIANYYCSYNKACVAAAAIIAVVATNVALFVFFKMRANWSNNWWKRLLCACVLAGAVSGMHWVATIGTYYRVRIDYIPSTSRLSRAQLVIICTVLSVGSCSILLSFPLLANRTERKSRQRAQQMALACAYFDETGRIMVSTDGQLPNTKITDSYEGRSFREDDFGKTHPAFLWVFRATRNWRTVKDLIPGMKDHLALNAGTKDFLRRSSKADILDDDDSYTLDNDFLMLFKEMFCVSASGLATQTHQPLETLGVLYEEPFETGTLSNNKLGFLSKILKKSGNYKDLEAGGENTMYFGQGHFLFVVRNLNKQDADKFAASNYRFADIAQVVDVQSKSMQVESRDLSIRLHSMQAYASSENLMVRGVHLAAFILRPTMRKGFDVLVPRDRSNQLPISTLPIQDLTPRHTEILKELDGMSVNQILKFLNTGHRYTKSRDLEFCQQLQNAFSNLVRLIHDSAFNDAIFSSRKIPAPARPLPGSTTIGRGFILSVRAMTNLHSSSPDEKKLVYKPLRLFNAQQQVYTGLTDHAAFARQMHREFFHIADRRNCEGTSIVSKHSFRSMQTAPRRLLLENWVPSRRAHSIASPPTIAEKSLVTTSSTISSKSFGSGTTPPGRSAFDGFGSIMVSNQVCVEVGDADESDKADTTPVLQLEEVGVLGTTGDAAFVDEEGENSRTYVDEIYGMFKRNSLWTQEH